jgi:hypothetical protein
MTIKPFHSKNCEVYHTNTRCGAANEIPHHDRVSGTGGYRQCKNCKKLDRGLNPMSRQNKLANEPRIIGPN